MQSEIDVRGAKSGRDTKADIHAAALELFSTRGYQNTSLREIAEQVGITKASLYYHYSSKQDLFRAIIGGFLEDLRAVLSSVATTPWSPENEVAVLTAYLDVVIRHRRTGPALMRDFTAVLVVFEDSLDDLISLARDLQAWLAGPDASVTDRICVAAASEIPGAVVSSAMAASDATDEQLRTHLLGAMQAVLSRREIPRTPGA